MPLSVTPGTLRAMVPLIRPASTPLFEISRAVPLLRVAIGLAPPRLMLTFVRATRTTGCGVGPVVVALSKAMLPLMVWPRMPRVTPTPSTRRYGPAGSTRLVTWPPTVTDELTGAAVLLMATARVPPRVTPGRLTAMLPPIRPATPVAVTTRKPLPLLRVTTPARSSPTPLSAR